MPAEKLCSHLMPPKTTLLSKWTLRLSNLFCLRSNTGVTVHRAREKNIARVFSETLIRSLGFHVDRASWQAMIDRASNLPTGEVL